MKKVLVMIALFGLGLLFTGIGIGTRVPVADAGIWVWLGTAAFITVGFVSRV